MNKTQIEKVMPVLMREIKLIMSELREKHQTLNRAGDISPVWADEFKERVRKLRPALRAECPLTSNQAEFCIERVLALYEKWAAREFPEPEPKTTAAMDSAKNL